MSRTLLKTERATQRCTRGYIVMVITVGLAISVYSCWKYVLGLLATDNLLREILDILVLTAICALLRSLPVYIRNDQALDLSIITLFASILLKGHSATVLVVLLSAFLVVETNRAGDERHHMFNTPLYKTLFNNANLIISLTVGGFVYERLCTLMNVTDLNAVQILLPSIGFLLPAFFLNATILMGLFSIMKRLRFPPMLGSVVRGLLPNLLSTAPMGYFLARFMDMGEGYEGYAMASLFILPLLFARYAFKLYLDSKEQFYKTIRTLTAAIEARDKYTEGHSRRVEMYSEVLANELKIHPTLIEDIKVAALLHDIGKIGIEDRILRKPGKLDPEEMDQIRAHPTIGLYILEDVDMNRNIKDTILYHHVFFNGKGYPAVGADKQVPLSAYIVALADAYDAMTSDRPYRSAIPREKAIEIIRENRGSQFHPVVVDAFLAIIEREGDLL